MTGATDGIGKAMAKEMAKKGMNVMLVARSKDKLKAVQEELASKYTKVKISTEVVDFANFSVKDCGRMTEVLSKIQVRDRSQSSCCRLSARQALQFYALR